MASNQNINKVVFGDTVLIDLSADTASPETVLQGQTLHDRSGAKVVGSCTYDADTKDANAKVAELLTGRTAYVGGAKITGTMPNRGAVNLKISTKTQKASIPQGYHDGSGGVQIDSAEQSKLIGSNIRQGVTILGVAGSMTGSESVRAQSKTVTPTKEQQIILPDDEYTCLSQVTVKGIPYAESDNPAGGKTATIG